jgi:hypothetical protein
VTFSSDILIPSDGFLHRFLFARTNGIAQERVSVFQTISVARRFERSRDLLDPPSCHHSHRHQIPADAADFSGGWLSDKSRSQTPRAANLDALLISIVQPETRSILAPFIPRKGIFWSTVIRVGGAAPARRHAAAVRRQQAAASRVVREREREHCQQSLLNRIQDSLMREQLVTAPNADLAQQIERLTTFSARPDAAEAVDCETLKRVTGFGWTVRPFPFHLRGFRVLGAYVPWPKASRRGDTEAQVEPLSVERLRHQPSGRSSACCLRPSFQAPYWCR